MATAYTCITPGATPVVCTGVPVALTGDTINGNDINNGAILVVTCAATPTNVSFVDPGHTLAGTAAATPTTYTVAANTSKAFGHTQTAGYIDPASGAVGVIYSAITNVTAQVLA
jgi:hypothetical protein